MSLEDLERLGRYEPLECIACGWTDTMTRIRDDVRVEWRCPECGEWSQ